MKRASVAAVFMLCFGLTVGCGGDKDEEAIAEREPEVAGRNEDRPVPITETGCLTASGDQFVLTDLERGAAGPDARKEQGGADPTASPQPTTQSYQLIGDAEALRSLVGRQVRVTGEAEPPRVAQVRESTPAAPPAGTAGTAGQQPAPPGEQRAKPGEPQVSATSETRLEVTQMRVRSITPTGEPCAATTPQDRQ